MTILYLIVFTFQLHSKKDNVIVNKEIELYIYTTFYDLEGTKYFKTNKVADFYNKCKACSPIWM